MTPCKKCGSQCDDCDLLDGYCEFCSPTQEIVLPGFEGRMLSRTEYKHCTQCGGRIKMIDYGLPNRKPERICIKCGINYDDTKA
jgi:hypothetical protein